ncbi:MAG: hypothetical protein P8M25_09815 [Paracoccaceae bacterium]|nr:hypothetical protein [Paracoccaceae bacterium]
MIDFIPQNGDSDPETDYVLFDWQINMSVDPETEDFYFIGSTSKEIDTWASLTNSHNTTEHGDVVVSELLNQLDPSDLKNIRIIAIDILDDDRTDILGQSIQSTDTDYLSSTKGFEDMESAVFDELGLSLNDIGFANMSFVGGSRGDLILEFANQGILTFASLPNDGLHAARYWDSYLKETVQDSATVAIDVAGSDSEGAGFPDSLQFADLLRSNSAETYPDWFGTSFATPEALGDVVANLLDADNETYLSLFADGSIMVSEVQTLVPVLDIV